MRFEIRTAALALASCALLVGGCGEDDATTSASVNGKELNIDAVVAAAEKDKVAKVDVTIDAKGLGLKKPVSVKATGTSALATVGLDLTVDAAPIADVAGIPSTALPAKLRLILTPEKGALETPATFRQQIPGQKQWILLDFSKLRGNNVAGLRNLLRVDIKSSLALFRKVKLQSAGQETVNGVQTTRWKGELSGEDLVAALPEAQREETRQALTSDANAKRDFTRKQPYEFWVDDAGRVHRTLQTQNISATTGSRPTPAGTFTVRIDISDFGQGDLPTVPPAKDSWDASLSAGALLSGSTAP